MTESDLSVPLLGAYAAKQCPVRLFRQYDPTEQATAAAPDDDLQQLFDDGIAFEVAMVERIVELHRPDQVSVIPGRHELDHDARRALTDDALECGTPIILGALMQPDEAGRRLGEIDILLATGGVVATSGKTEYRAIDVKSHRGTANDPAAAGIEAGVHDLMLLQPTGVAGLVPKYREDDSLQLAHYHRLLQALGHAGDDRTAVGGILGMDEVVAWHDLNSAQFGTVTPQETDSGISYHRRARTTKRTALDRYDFEFQFRVTIVDTAVRRTDRTDEPIVRPVKVKECERCDWRDVCDADLRAIDDVSLVNGVNYPEWRVHRFMGIDTVRQLAALDIDEAVVRYADTPITKQAITTQIECARAAAAGQLIVRPDWDPARLPRGDIEVDLDMENADHVYLWGARLTRVPSGWPDHAATYVPFATFDPIDNAGEVALAEQLWTWLGDLRDRSAAGGHALRVYVYSGAEAQHLRRLLGADRVEGFLASEQYVDLLPLLRAKFWSNAGHGLKVTAAASGFAWRDVDPGGYASMRWYEDARAGNDRAANIARILAYNEDDCRATAALRQ